MSKTNFQTLQDITESLSNRINKLSKGKLSAAEIESLTNDARELYERLIVIRFKSYEQLDEVNTDDVIEQSETEVVPVIDKGNVKETDNIVVPEDDGMMMFDFSEPVVESKSVEVKTKEEQVVDDEVESDAAKTVGDVDAIEKSLNDNFKDDHKSLGDKFTKSPIDDLNTSIGINKKFSFISELFAGDSDAYNAAIAKLNAFDAKESAFAYLESVKETNQWIDDNEVAASFVDLIERRYLS